MLQAELYENTPGKRVFIRAYITGIKENTPISVEEADTKINPILSVTLQEATSMGVVIPNSNRRVKQSVLSLLPILRLLLSIM